MIVVFISNFLVIVVITNYLLFFLSKITSRPNSSELFTFSSRSFSVPYICSFIMRPSSLGGGRILRRTLSVRLSVCLSVRPVIVTERHVAPPSELQ